MPLPEGPQVPSDNVVPIRPGGAFARCWAFTRAEEGGFSDDPRDPGGATNFGITLAALAEWRGVKPGDLAPADVASMGESEAEAIARVLYWDRLGCAHMFPGLDLMVFDDGFNRNPEEAVRLLQYALGMPTESVDGICGPLTIKRADTWAFSPNEMGWQSLLANLHYLQAGGYLVSKNFRTFGRGWIGRCVRRYHAAITSGKPVPVGGARVPDGGSAL